MVQQTAKPDFTASISIVFVGFATIMDMHLRFLALDHMRQIAHCCHIAIT